MMTRQEFVDWQAFYLLHPFDDYHRHYRPAALLGEVISGASRHSFKADDLLAWLRKDPSVEQFSERNSIAAHGLTPPAEWLEAQRKRSE